MIDKETIDQLIEEGKITEERVIQKNDNDPVLYGHAVIGVLDSVTFNSLKSLGLTYVYKDNDNATTGGHWVFITRNA